jgi:hypothetical protein
MQVGIHTIPDMIKDDEVTPFYFTIEVFQGEILVSYRADKGHTVMSTLTKEISIEQAVVEFCKQFEEEKHLLVEDKCTFWLWNKEKQTHEELK